MNREQTKFELRLAYDPAYQAFQARLIPGQNNILGVRMPKLRALAKRIAASDFETWLDDPQPDVWYEETMLRGIVIATAPMDIEKRLTRTAAFVPNIDNWAVCDCVCSSFSPDSLSTWWDFLQPYLQSHEQFPARFGAVMVLHHFSTAPYLTRSLSALVHIPAKGHYARMGVAWALSDFGVRFLNETLAFLNQSTLDDWTYNKALQKMLESRRLPDCWRAKVRLHKSKSSIIKP